jgi:hypothetical protein
LPCLEFSSKYVDKKYTLFITLKITVVQIKL